MTKALEGAYITDGLSLELARSYSTQHAVKAMTKNCTIDKVKLIMQAGTFSTMNDAVSKFVNSVTEATGQSNTVLYFKNYPQRGSNRGRGNYRGNFRGNHNNLRPDFIEKYKLATNCKSSLTQSKRRFKERKSKSRLLKNLVDRLKGKTTLQSSVGDSNNQN